MTTLSHVGPVPALAAIDDALMELASAQEGVLTTAQLRAAGLDARALVALVRSGVLTHPGRGLYVVAALERHEPEARHRQLARGAVLLYPDAVLVSATAVLAHGLPVFGSSLARPQLRRCMKRSGGMSAFWMRPSPGPSVLTSWGPTSIVADALALHAIDHGITSGVVSADAALHRGLVSVDDLSVAVDAVAGWVHGSRAVAMRSLADGRRESVGESRCGIALAIGGIAVTPQVEITDGRGRFVARVDFLVDGTKVVVEFDGKVKYESGDPAVLWAEKRREDELRALGYVVVRITWADLERPGAVVAKVRAAVALAG
jgi:very-short-patch-repair endonuclease